MCKFVFEESTEKSPSNASPSDGSDIDEDVKESLDRECSSLRHDNGKRYSQVKTGVKNCLFVISPAE